MGSIYKITNTLNGKSYIGQTIHDAEKKRIRYHFDGHGNRVLKNAIKKYGREAFTFEILHDGIIPEFLNTLEIEAIAKFNTIAPHGYNLTTGGESSSHSEETKRKISESKTGERNPNYGKPRSAETRRKQSEANKGKKRAPETKRKISESKTGEKNPNYGKPISEETKRKMSEANKGKTAWNKDRSFSEETKRKMSEAHEDFDCKAARKVFFSLPSDIDLKVKRKHLRQKFPHKHRSTIHRWCRKFDSET